MTAKKVKAIDVGQIVSELVQQASVSLVRVEGSTCATFELRVEERCERVYFSSSGTQRADSEVGRAVFHLFGPPDGELPLEVSRLALRKTRRAVHEMLEDALKKIPKKVLWNATERNRKEKRKCRNEKHTRAIADAAWSLLNDGLSAENVLSVVQEAIVKHTQEQ